MKPKTYDQLSAFWLRVVNLSERDINQQVMSRNKVAKLYLGVIWFESFKNRQSLSGNNSNERKVFLLTHCKQY